ncbi:6-phosphogluconolactonase [Nocardioides thalensis]|uniref:6-phosphogluconolactonase n=1 Tax=Nocardioides thalensis TaxID=1914755 RepID=A0A853C3W5_9ACTN|nr:6-phosphogluconolactonase [Nocardioides thalensis]NYJ01258.1 6-phosphogluconolactonase [Nocardioides thalensis]
MTDPAPLVEVHDSPELLATAVAGELLNRIADAQAAGHVPHISLTGGTIAVAIHEEVARHAPASGVDWGAVHVWFGDERFVAPDSPDRNAGQARAAFIDAVGVPDANVHEFPSTADAADVDEAAARYAEELRAHWPGRFDVMMLGVGPDGHVNSLFPGFPQLTATGPTAGVTGSPKPPPERVTLTFETTSAAASVWFLVSGDGKADAVRRALADDGSVQETPARGVTGQAETIWFLDTAAASLL